MGFYDPQYKNKQAVWDEPTRRITFRLPQSLCFELERAAGKDGKAAWVRDVVMRELKRGRDGDSD